MKTTLTSQHFAAYLQEALERQTVKKLTILC